MRLEPTELTQDEQALRAEVRAFLAARLPAGSYPLGLGMAGDVDPEFSRDLGARGWLGMALPKEYGGGGGARSIGWSSWRSCWRLVPRWAITGWPTGSPVRASPLMAPWSRSGTFCPVSRVGSCASRLA